jgi:uncharacterized damage-inducible protein DinB
VVRSHNTYPRPLKYTHQVEIQSLDTFLDYYEKIRKRTERIIQCIPPDKIDWTYAEEKFTFADLIRHLAGIERYMYAENAQFQQSAYPGHGKHLAGTYDEVMKYFQEKHAESMEIFRRLTQEQLNQKCALPSGTSITLWKWLRGMVEHEIHHRGQIYLYLAMLNIPTPPLYGLTSEEVFKKSRKF